MALQRIEYEELRTVVFEDGTAILQGRPTYRDHWETIPVVNVWELVQGEEQQARADRRLLGPSRG